VKLYRRATQTGPCAPSSSEEGLNGQVGRYRHVIKRALSQAFPGDAVLPAVTEFKLTHRRGLIGLLALSRFHLFVKAGVTWILDGLEVTSVGAIGPVLPAVRNRIEIFDDVDVYHPPLRLSAPQVGNAVLST
jgi:hypothetical protein